jgi:hypothetical protein
LLRRVTAVALPLQDGEQFPLNQRIRCAEKIEDEQSRTMTIRVLSDCAEAYTQLTLPARSS